MLCVNLRPALASSVAPEKLGQKIVLHRQLTNLGVELLYLLFIVLGLDRVPAEHVLGSFDQALLPVLNLIGVNVELLGQLSQSALTLQRCQCYLRLEG